MRKLFLVPVFFALAVPCFAEPSQLEFRAVLAADDAETASHEYAYAVTPSRQPEKLRISDEIILSNQDFQAIEIVRKADDLMPDSKKFPAIVIKLAEEGKKKFFEATQRNKQIAVLLDGEVFLAPRIAEPIPSGVVKLKSWKLDTDEKAAAFVKGIGFKPVFREKPKKQTEKEKSDVSGKSVRGNKPR